jgi:hypothetical protein
MTLQQNHHHHCHHHGLDLLICSWEWNIAIISYVVTKMYDCYHKYYGLSFKLNESNIMHSSIITIHHINCSHLSNRRTVTPHPMGSVHYVHHHNLHNTSRLSLKGSDDGVYNTQNYWVFGLCPVSHILKTREHNISETGSVSILMWGGHTYSVGSLKAWVVQWLRSAPSKRPNRVGVSPLT